MPYSHVGRKTGSINSKLDGWKQSFYDGEPETRQVSYAADADCDSLCNPSWSAAVCKMHNAWDGQTRPPTDAGHSSWTAHVCSVSHGICILQMLSYPVLKLCALQMTISCYCRVTVSGFDNFALLQWQCETVWTGPCCCCPENGLFSSRHSRQTKTPSLRRSHPLGLLNAVTYNDMRHATTCMVQFEFEINIKLSTINSKGLNRLIARKEIIAKNVMIHDWSKSSNCANRANWSSCGNCLKTTWFWNLDRIYLHLQKRQNQINLVYVSVDSDCSTALIVPYNTAP